MAELLFIELSTEHVLPTIWILRLNNVISLDRMASSEISVYVLLALESFKRPFSDLKVLLLLKSTIGMVKVLRSNVSRHLLDPGVVESRLVVTDVSPEVILEASFFSDDVKAKEYLSVLLETASCQISVAGSSNLKTSSCLNRKIAACFHSSESWYTPIV